MKNRIFGFVDFIEAAGLYASTTSANCAVARGQASFGVAVKVSQEILVTGAVAIRTTGFFKPPRDVIGMFRIAMVHRPPGEIRPAKFRRPTRFDRAQRQEID